MNIWIFLFVSVPFFGAFYISRLVSSNATKALEPHHKAMLVDFSTGLQKYTIVWLVLAIVPIFVVPRAGIIIFALLVLAGNWLTLKRLWSLDFPITYKQQLRTASVIFTVGVVIGVFNFYSVLSWS